MDGCVDIWIRAKCAECHKEEKCEPYSLDMILCILDHINQERKAKEEMVVIAG